MSWFSDAVDAVEQTVSDAANAVTDAAEELGSDMQDALDDLANDVTDSWNDFSEQPGVFNFLAGVVGTVGAAVGFGADVLGAGIGFGTAAVGAVLGGGLGLLVSIFSPDSGPKLGRAIERGAALAGDVLQAITDGFGSVQEWIVGLFASGLLWVDDLFRCPGYATGAPKAPPATSFEDVRHVFVVMLENRSFDHLLGLLPGVNGWSINAPKSNFDLDSVPSTQGDNANQSLNVDPPHEFSEVQLQLEAGRSSVGFAKVWHRRLLDETGGASAPEIQQILAGFGPDRAPVLNALAAEFAVCDAWHSSLPGPTYPNRLFAYAADSGGLADSPKTLSLAAYYASGITFQRGTFFDLLDHNCQPWRVYQGDAFPMVSTLKNVRISRMGDFRKISPTKPEDDEFAKDLANANEWFPRFTFIEPDYGKFYSNFRGGNSQHPLDGCARGERLTKHIYDNLRNSPIWERSALIITYDEHGGFFDHVVPPTAHPPNTDRRHRDLQGDVAFENYTASKYGGIALTHQELNPKMFAFDRLGVRVPAVVVSPLIPKGTVAHTKFDHSTIIRTYCDLNNLHPLTDRDRYAASLSGLFTAGGVRSSMVTAPEVNTR